MKIGKRGCYIRNSEGAMIVPACKGVTAMDTIGAGDNFNAGFVFGLIKDGITREDIDRGLSEAQWDSLLVSAQEFSTECCKDIYNYVSKEFGEEKKK